MLDVWGKRFLYKFAYAVLKDCLKRWFLIDELATEIFSNLERKTFEHLIFQLFFATIIKKHYKLTIGLIFLYHKTLQRSTLLQLFMCILKINDANENQFANFCVEGGIEDT